MVLKWKIIDNKGICANGGWIHISAICWVLLCSLSLYLVPAFLGAQEGPALRYCVHRLLVHCGNRWGITGPCVAGYTETEHVFLFCFNVCVSVGSRQMPVFSKYFILKFPGENQFVYPLSFCGVMLILTVLPIQYDID